MLKVLAHMTMDLPPYIDVRLSLQGFQPLLLRPDRHGILKSAQMLPFLDLRRPCKPGDS